MNMQDIRCSDRQGGKKMKVTSRVVYTKGKYKGLTGTVTDYIEHKLHVSLDNGETVECNINDVLTIDDITHAGNIEFELGMKIYDVQLNMVGEITEVEQIDDIKSYTVKFEDGKVLTYPLFEEFNYIVVE
jgi:hypothetical protein